MTTRTKAKFSCCFLCFTNAAAIDDDNVELQSKLAANKAGESGRKQRRILSKLSRSLKSMSSENGDSKRGEESDSSELESSSQKPQPAPTLKSVEDDSRLSKTLSSSFSLSSISTSSSLSSLSSSSSCRSVIAAEQVRSPATEAEPTKTERNSAEDRRCSSAKGLVVLLVSLSLIVLCGRVSAIVLISSWLCLVARRSLDLRPGAVPLMEEDGGLKALIRRGREVGELEEKKRVVLEGLLERNRKSFGENFKAL